MMPDKSGIKILLFSILFLITTNAFAKAPAYPAWYTNDGLEEEYPSTKYIREMGSGKTKLDAENDAVAYISRYFQTNVSVNAVSRTTGITTNGETSMIQEMEITNEISSNMQLFGIKYSDCYYNKKERTYYIVAYIDINDAWNRYEPELTLKRNEFMAYYEAAQVEQEPVVKIKLLNDARIAAQAFEDKLSFANALSKKLTEKNFGSDIKTLSNLPSLIKRLMVENPVYIKINDDYSGTIEAAIRNVLTQKGFSVTATKDKASYIADIQVDYNKADGTSRITLYPALYFSLEGKNASVFTFNGESERVVAPNENSAKKIASENLANNINENLSRELEITLGL